MEPVNLLGKEKFSAVDIRLRVKGGGHVSQAYGAAHCLHAILISHRVASDDPATALELRLEAFILFTCTVIFAGLAEQISRRRLSTSSRNFHLLLSLV